MPEQFSLKARYVFPVTAAPLEGGTVVIRNGRITRVSAKTRTKPDRDLGNVAIVPGFVNAHTHLDLTGAAGKIPPNRDFVLWLKNVIAYRSQRSTDQVVSDVERGIADSLRHGTTLVGDITSGGVSWDPLCHSPIRATVYCEFLGLSQERAVKAWQSFVAWQKAAFAELKEHVERFHCQPGISPHAPYSTSRMLYCTALLSSLPLATHLAETREELELLQSKSGPFVDFLRGLGAWPTDLLMKNIDEFFSIKGSPAPRIIAHGNYLDPSQPLPPNTTIVFCPRTHQAFGHSEHPFREFLNRGVHVALGTDSLASNPDLSVFEEARFLHRKYPDFSGEKLLRMATLSGAEATGWGKKCGSLTAGKYADFTLIQLPDQSTDDPYSLLFSDSSRVQATFIQGQLVGGDW